MKLEAVLDNNNQISILINNSDEEEEHFALENDMIYHRDYYDELGCYDTVEDAFNAEKETCEFSFIVKEKPSRKSK